MNNKQRLFWIRFAVVIALTALAYYAHRQQPLSAPDQPVRPSQHDEISPDRPTKPNLDSRKVELPENDLVAPERDQPESHRARDRQPPDRSKHDYLVPNVTIRDERGQVAYRGQIDLSPTLERISSGDRLRFRNDGAVFENRERRLPQRRRGYYHEFVHPTPGLDGPGPQRVVLGDAGEVYYTSNHYRSFQRLDDTPPGGPPR